MTVPVTGTDAESPVDPSGADAAVTADRSRQWRKLGRAVAEAVPAVVVAAVVAVVLIVAIRQVQWPAYPSSNQLRALTTVGQFVALAMLVVAILWARRPATTRWPMLARPLSWVGLSTLVTITLAMPLGATSLYLGGLSVDQEFRTQYLSRFVDSAALRDMNYIDIPPFYPAGWFWVGGRLAALTGIDGWAFFAPYSIAALAVCAVLALVLWTHLINTDVAILAATTVAVVTLAHAAPEPYAAVLVVLIPPVLLLAWGALARSPGEGWAAIVGTGLFLGMVAATYTLYLFWLVLTLVLMASAAAFGNYRRSAPADAIFWPFLRLIPIGVIAVVIALPWWLPYLWRVLRGGGLPGGGSAMHYLPGGGATLPLPMLSASLLGLLCLLGTGWLVLLARSSRRAAALGVGIVAVYLWVLLSMAATVIGTTLLGFRLEPVVIALLATAGVFGFVDGVRAIHLATNESARTLAMLLVLGGVAGAGLTQSVPATLAGDIDTAYTDTDGNGVRADKRPPSSVAFYPEIDRVITENLDRPRDETVVLTADYGFLSLYPYFGYQSLTSHYANPMARFEERAAQIAAWSKLTGPDELLAAMDESPWRAPDVFVFRTSPDGYTLRLAEDVYPNDPNVRRYTVTFPASLFDNNNFATELVGPFAVVIRR